MKKIVIFLILSVFAGMSYAQVIGDFTLPDIRTGNDISLAEFSGKDAVVVIFTSLNCPYDAYYTSRIESFISEFSKRNVQVLLINSIPTEDVSDLKTKVSSWKAPYLADKQQVVMKLLGVTKSPEALILVPVNGGFRKRYQGAIDNNPQVPSDVKKPYLIQNLKDILANQPLTYADILPVGCRIRTP